MGAVKKATTPKPTKAVKPAAAPAPALVVPPPPPPPAPVVAAKPEVKAAPVFPKKELDAWLKTHTTWGHEDWMGLLASLSSKGYSYWTDSQEKANELGLYLESNRNKAR